MAAKTASALLVTLTLAACADEAPIAATPQALLDGKLLVARDLTDEQRVTPISIPSGKSVRFRPGKDPAGSAFFVDDLAVRDAVRDGDVFVLTADAADAPVVRVWLLDGDDGLEASGSYQDLATLVTGRFVDAADGAYLDLPVPTRCDAAVAVQLSAHAGELVVRPEIIVIAAGCD